MSKKGTMTDLKKVDEATVNALACAKHWEMEIQAFTRMVSDLRGNYPRSDKDLDAAVSTIHYRMVQKELEAWRRAFMWALNLPTKVRDEIRKRAHERFLSSRMAVMNHLHSKIDHPLNWSVEAEEEFRKEIQSWLEG